MHVTDMSYGKVGHPSDICKVGEVMKVRVIRFDRERGRISLGLSRRNRPLAGHRQPVRAGSGSREGHQHDEIRRLRGAGAGVEGLLHISRCPGASG